MPNLLNFTSIAVQFERNASPWLHYPPSASSLRIRCFCTFFPGPEQLLSLLHRSRAASHVLQIHAQLIATALISSPFFASRLLMAISQISNFSSSSSDYAELVFSQICQPNTFIWNTLIRHHAMGLNPLRAILFYRQMQREGVVTDNYTYPFVLKACGLVLGLEEGTTIHGEIVKRGFGSDLYVRNGLISMYCRCEEVAQGRKLFHVFLQRDLVSWNSMISGYASCGDMNEAQKLFDEMPGRDAFSWAIMINGYGKKLMDVDRARKLFNEMPNRDLVCWNSMIDGYAGLGRMESARELFEAMPEKNVISWSIVIDGYARHGDPKEALDLFQEMLIQGTKLDKVSAVGAISACAQLGALEQGKWVHFYLVKHKILLDIVVQTTLIDMYMKCGSVDHATRVFQSMVERNAVSWNVMIVGLGANGHGEKALELFYLMEREGTLMDDLTFLGILMSCTHAGLVTEGLKIFARMKSDFGLEPKVEHYGCLVDLLGRAGRLIEAKNVIETIPMKASSALWGSLLAACRMHRSVHLAEVSVEQLVELGADDCGVYVLMSNIYAEERMWEDVWRIRRLMSDRGMKKESGMSAIEVDGIVHEFINGDKSHFLMEEIYKVVGHLTEMLIFAT